jgi:hypothetical protein
MGPPRTYPIDSVPEAQRREAFLEWMASRPPVKELLATLDRKSWRDDQIICPKTYWALTTDDMEALKRETKNRIAEEHIYGA